MAACLFCYWVVPRPALHVAFTSGEAYVSISASARNGSRNLLRMIDRSH
jgi:hypothetical protein